MTRLERGGDNADRLEIGRKIELLVDLHDFLSGGRNVDSQATLANEQLAE